ncbi:MAG TPA: hypothetical protein PKL31_09085 [Fulvivirga sp.]|nr:hypothetical protein [Fulvivirga sp.]
MNDKIDQFIKDNRAAFDDKEPSEKLWARIDKNLKGSTSFQWLWKVAAVVFFCTSLGLFFNQRTDKMELMAQKEKVATDFKDVESFYFQMISQRKDLIYTYKNPDENLDVAFEQDLQKLDAMYEVLKEELKANPSKKVVDALILNLLVRIDVLNEKIDELDHAGEKSEKDKEVAIDDANV